MTNVEAIFSKQSVETFLRFFLSFWGGGRGGGAISSAPSAMYCLAVLGQIATRLQQLVLVACKHSHVA